MNFTRLLLAFALEVVMAVAIPLPVQLYVISLRLSISIVTNINNIKHKNKPINIMKKCNSELYHG